MALQSIAEIEKVGYILDNIESGMNELYSFIPSIKERVDELKSSGDILNETFELSGGKIIHTRTYVDVGAFVKHTDNIDFKNAGTTLSDNGWSVILREMVQI